MVGNNFAGPDARSQQNLAWVPNTDQMTPLALNLLRNQQLAAARRGLAKQQSQAVKDQVAAKQAEIFKQGPHDAGLLTGVYNSRFYKPFMAEQFARNKEGQLDPTDFYAKYGEMGAAANFLKQEGTKFEKTIEQREKAEPYYNWGDIKQKAMAATESELQKHLDNGGSLESFMPNYNQIVQESIRGSNDYFGNEIGRKFLQDALKGSTKRTIQFTNEAGRNEITETDVPNFVNIDQQGRITGFNTRQIVDSFMAYPGGEGYLKFKSKELYDSDPNFRQKFDAFKDDPVKFNNLLYEKVVRPVTGNPLANRDVAFRNVTELPKTTDEDLEEMQAATPIPGRLTVPRTSMGQNKTDFLAPTISFSLTGKQFNNYKQPINVPQYRLSGGKMEAIPFSEQTYNRGLADKKVDFVSLPVLNDNLYFKDKKDGQIKPFTTGKGQLMILTPDRVDQAIKKVGAGNVFINTGTPKNKSFTPVPSGEFAMRLADPNAAKSWVSYRPFAKVGFVGQAGPFPVEGKSDMASLMMQKTKGASPDSKAETERFGGEKANPQRFIPIWQSSPGFIQDIIRNVGQDKFNEMLRQLPQQTYLDFLGGREGQQAEAQTIIP